MDCKRIAAVFALMGTTVSLGTVLLAAAVQTFALDTDSSLKKPGAKSREKSKAMPVERKKLDDAESAGYLWFESQGFERLYMTNDRGEKLCGYYLPPRTGCNVLAFLCHGFKANAFKDPMMYVKHYHEELGYGIFVMDHTASGESEGRYVGFSGFEADDCIKWINYINENKETYNILLHGVSMGGATVMRMCGAENLPSNVRVCVEDCGFTSAWNQMIHEFSAVNVPVYPLLPVVNGVNKVRAGYSFKDCDALDRVRNAKIPILFIHGENDKFVPTHMVYELFESCPTDKELLIVPNATHATSVLYEPELYWDFVENFTSKYLK